MLLTQEYPSVHRRRHGDGELGVRSRILSTSRSLQQGRVGSGSRSGRVSRQYRAVAIEIHQGRVISMIRN